MATETRVDVQVRELPPGEWTRLKSLPDFTEGLPDPQAWRIIVAEEGGEGGRIVAYNCVYDAVHAEPVWIHPDYRHRPVLFKRLWQGTLTVLDDLGARLVHVCVRDDLPRQQQLVERFGFVPAPAKLYILDTWMMREDLGRRESPESDEEEG